MIKAHTHAHTLATHTHIHTNTHTHMHTHAHTHYVLTTQRGIEAVSKKHQAGLTAATAIMSSLAMLLGASSEDENAADQPGKNGAP